MDSELKLINFIKKQITHHSQTKIGIGDDAALVDLKQSTQLLLTADTLIEGSHFDLSTMDPYAVGRKSVCVNLSDLAAKAATPLFALICLNVRRDINQKDLESLCQGMIETCRQFDVDIIGGDTCSSNSALSVSITMAGRPHRKGVPRRSGAQVGDLIYVTGPLGGSFESGRHLRFNPRMREAQCLMDQLNVHAMIDISDGLATDLRHICIMSKVGAIIDSRSVPIHADVASDQNTDHRIKRALTDGEDFELCFCIPRESSERLASLNPLFSVYRIGEITADTTLKLRLNNKTTPFEHFGFEHKF